MSQITKETELTPEAWRKALFGSDKKPDLNEPNVLRFVVAYMAKFKKRHPQPELPAQRLEFGRQVFGCSSKKLAELIS